LDTSSLLVPNPNSPIDEVEVLYPPNLNLFCWRLRPPAGKAIIILSGERWYAMIYKFKVIIEQDEDGIYIVSCPSLQGCYSQGDTIDEALENIKDAIRLHIEARKSLGESIPVEIALEEVEVSA